jgi:hypothetical protein
LSQINNNIWLVVIATVILVVGGFIAKVVVGWRRDSLWKRRGNLLLVKYRDPDIVEKIMARMIWKHMTRDQLLDSWGRPSQEEERQDKGGVKEILRYGARPGRPLGQRVILENGLVIGWDTKST